MKKTASNYIDNYTEESFYTFILEEHNRGDEARVRDILSDLLVNDEYEAFIECMRSSGENWSELEGFVTDNLQRVLDKYLTKVRQTLPKDNKVLITIEGGVVQGVSVNFPDAQIIVVDYDPKGDEPVIVGQIVPDKFKGNASALITGESDDEIFAKKAVEEIENGTAANS